MPSAHIFCKVVDNFGDMGVCWRLACQLRHEHGYAVRLYIDRPEGLRYQDAAIEVHPWDAGYQPPDVLPDLLLETFSCRLPEVLLQAMARTPTPPRWVNLEHLSGESWAQAAHGLVSLHPATGLRREFFFPGFSPQSGGLLREQSLIAARNSFAAPAWWQHTLQRPWDESLKVSLFCYPDAPKAHLLAALAGAGRPVTLLIAQSVTLPDAHLPATVTAITLPWLRQPEFDRLLWSCDLNLVRGEDSFIRALWAGRPFLWQAYVQPENAHFAKISAFLGHYLPHFQPAQRETLEKSMGLWNTSPAAALEGLAQLLAQLPALQAQARPASDHFAAQSDCVSRLLGLAL